MINAFANENNTTVYVFSNESLKLLLNDSLIQKILLKISYN